MPYRVVQWATGSVGHVALRAVIEHPDLELVAVLVHDPDKQGKDAAELAGLSEPTGIRATTDVDAILGSNADCVVHAARNTKTTVDEMAQILEAGFNLVSTALQPAVYPPTTKSGSRRSIDRLALACDKGGVSCFVSGADPGFVTDALPVFLTSIVGRVDSIRIAEILCYAEYDDADTQFRYFGFGQPMDSPDPPYFAPGRLARYWGPGVEMVAAGLGVELDEVREVTERAPAPTRIELPIGSVEAGTVGGLRFEVQGIVDDEPLVILEHVTRLDRAVAPDWPQPSHPDGCYRIRVDGWPSYELDLRGADLDASGYEPMENAAALRVVNAIPLVCDASPGLLSPFDLGLLGTPGLTARSRRG